MAKPLERVAFTLQPVTRFVYHSYFPRTTPQKVLSFYARKDAIEKVTPAIASTNVIRDTRKDLSGEVEVSAFFGLLKLHVKSVRPQQPYYFAERLVNGSLDFWQHSRALVQEDGGVTVIDSVKYAHKKGIQGLITKVLLNPVTLQVLFKYREKATISELSKQ